MEGKMRVLITGGAGYKGVVLAKKLLEAGHDVTILDNFMYGYSSVMHLVNHPKFSVLKVDVRNLKEKDISGYDVVYHLAGISGMPACAANPASAEAINVHSTRQLVKFLSKDQILINASTTSMYGANDKICDENTKIEPEKLSLYGKTKYEAEKIVQEREGSISLRFATVFGVSPRMRNELLPNDFVYKAINDRSIVMFASNSKRTFVHITDAINAYAFALENYDKMKGDVYNVGTAKMNLSKMDIALEISKYIKCELIDSSLPDADIRNFEISFDKLHSLGYDVKYTFEDGIKELVKLYSFYVQYLPYQII